MENNTTPTVQDVESRRLTKQDLWKIYINSQALACGFNYLKQEAPGFTMSMISVIEKCYTTEEEKIEAYRRHTELFLTEARLSHIPIGIAAAMEERYALEGDIDPASINEVKTALMGPLAAIGDSLYHGTWRPILAGIAISLVIASNYTSIVGPLMFLILMAVSGQLLRHWGVFSGYKNGAKLVAQLQGSDIMQNFSQLTAIAAFTVLGGFASRFVSVNTPISYKAGETVVSLQSILDGLVPGLLALLFTGLVYWLIDKKKVSPNWLILAIMLFGIVGVWLKFLS